MPTLTRIIVLLTLAIGLAPAPASAELLCGKTLGKDALVGNYNMKIGPGTWYHNGTPRPYGKTHNLPATIYRVGNKLILKSNRGFNLTFLDVSAGERDWKFKKGDYGLTMDSGDIALAAGCDNINDLPRLHAKGLGSYLTNDGSKAKTVMKLFAWGKKGDEGIRALGGMSAASKSIVFHLRVTLTPN